MRIEFIVPGKPKSKSRPRFANGRAYTDAATRAAEVRIRECARRHAPIEPWDGPIVVEIAFHFRRPRDGRSYHLSRPDLDNLVKILDALNGLIWIDDQQLIRIVAEKHYSLEEKTCIKVTRK